MKGIQFTSKRGNHYFYDDLTGQIYTGTPDEFAAISEKYLKLTTDRRLISHNQKTVSPEEVKEYLCKEANGFKQLLLETTSFCNLRCKYCIYSDHYQYMKTYENKHMDFSVAQAAVDYYFTNFKPIYFRNPTRTPVIGFYGGEPLLNFPLIRTIVEYIQETYPEYEEVQYNVTTNGLCFTEEVQEFLTKNNFSIIVSIDGYKENHDRNRVKIDGKGSFDEIMHNVKTFKEKYKDYAKFAVSSCYDLKTDMFEYKDFFDNEDLFLARLAPVDVNNTTYYDQFTFEERREFSESLEAMKSLFLNLTESNHIRKDSFLYSLIGMNYSGLAFHPMMNEKRPGMLPFTASCIPGEKIYVTIDGNYHICEKINTHHSIGTIEEGIDFGEIAGLINDFKNNICTDCENCNVTRFCNICFQQCATDHDFEKSGSICANVEAQARVNLADFIEVLEANPSLFEEITIDYYKSIFEKVGVILE
ncbi:radical SAM protein [Paenibacillus zanthoxyli]|uniref:radical SAM protein n=1 Tax=Paenibacillus zanthoxyli TaxID=369399 RepID=UPI0004702260|nr:radical SAM protein [Paenibacillus zanthoxyli]